MLEEFLNELMNKKIQEFGKKETFEKVLDIGGKDGKYSHKISDNLTVIDLKPQNLILSVNYVSSDIREFESKEKYDLIICSAFLEHFTQEEGGLILSKINKFLKSEGFTFITCPNAWSLNRILGEMIGMGNALELNDADIKVGHKYLYNLSRLKKIVKENLKFIKSGSYFLKPLPTLDMNKIFDRKSFESFASINSENYPHLKEYLAEIYVIAKKK
ncbi:MAG: class I SAM-dependent methyltransferase [Candidatus Hodarchaeota archaeon]